MKFQDILEWVVIIHVPFPAEQVAVAKYWYEKYGAVPAAITYDEIEFYVERPPQTLEEAKKLAVEHYCFLL